MKLLMSILAALGLQLMVVPAQIALADSGRTPAEATAHALDELANVCAQHRPECPPTLTPTPTWTPSPMSTGTPLPTDTPTPTPTATLTPTAEPCWVTDQELGDPDNGYIVFDELGEPVPCPPRDDNPPPESTPSPSPTSTPTPTRAPLIQAPAPAAQVQVVVQTVVVVVTAVPTETPLPTVTAAATSTPRPMPASSSTSTRSPTAAHTGTPTVVTAASRQSPAAVGFVSTPSVDWSLLGMLLGSAVVLLAAVGIGVAIKRRTVVRRPRPPRGETFA